MPAEFPPFDLYEELELSPRAGSEVIEAAWHRLSRMFHPDSSETRAAAIDPVAAEARMKRINAAHDVLKDPDERARYDAWRAADRGGSPGAAPSPGPATTPGDLRCPRCRRQYRTVSGLQWHRANVEACA